MKSKDYYFSIIVFIFLILTIYSNESKSDLYSSSKILVKQNIDKILNLDFYNYFYEFSSDGELEINFIDNNNNIINSNKISKLDSVTPLYISSLNLYNDMYFNEIFKKKDRLKFYFNNILYSKILNQNKKINVSFDVIDNIFSIHIPLDENLSNILNRYNYFLGNFTFQGLKPIGINYRYNDFKFYQCKQIDCFFPNDKDIKINEILLFFYSDQIDMNNLYLEKVTLEFLFYEYIDFKKLYKLNTSKFEYHDLSHIVLKSLSSDSIVTLNKFKKVKFFSNINSEEEFKIDNYNKFIKIIITIISLSLIYLIIYIRKSHYIFFITVLLLILNNIFYINILGMLSIVFLSILSIFILHIRKYK